nr:MAG TPA: hypothetical protein [Caudoviricetes sp.]
MNQVHVKSLGTRATETKQAAVLAKALKQNDKTTVRDVLSNMVLSDLQINALHDVFKRLK